MNDEVIFVFHKDKWVPLEEWVDIRIEAVKSRGLNMYLPDREETITKYKNLMKLWCTKRNLETAQDKIEKVKNKLENCHG